MNPTDVSIADSRGKLQWLTGASDRDNAAAAASAAAKQSANSKNAGRIVSAAAAAAATTSGGNASSSNSGGFGALGLDAGMLDTISNTMHFVNPTPIQRKTIPLLMQGADVVAMARTGSGKSAAFIVPMIHRLREHSNLVGVRGVIFSPTRELALQTLRHFRMLAKHTDLRSSALTGGDSLNAQFEALAENPDVVVASPGRLLHMCEETHQNLLSRVQVCVLDEADRLFEMGFQAQIVALIKKVPEAAQRCLFSATMPTILAEFTEAGLHNPIVVRLDSETKLSNTLKHSAFVVRGEEKYGALIYLLVQLIGVRCEVISTNQATAEPLRKRVNAVAAARNRAKGTYRTGGGGAGGGGDNDDEDDEDFIAPGAGRGGGIEQPKQVLVFVESKHHVEFIGEVLPQCYGISTVAIHGHLDQEARRDAIATFRRRNASVLVVTDVAARGIDLPALDYIINFSFPHEPKLFVHRVGRVARAGREGSAFSILTSDDMPYYFDVMNFIGTTPLCRRPGTKKKKQRGASNDDDGDGVFVGDDGDEEDDEETAAAAANFTPDDGCYGRLPTHSLQSEVDTLHRLIRDSFELTSLFGVTQRSHEKYMRTKKRATHTGMRAAHEDEDLRYENIPVHPMLEEQLADSLKEYHSAVQDLRKFKPKETVLDLVHGEQQFHVGPRANKGTGSAMLKKMTNEILNSGGAQQQQQQQAKKDGKLSLAEQMAQRAAQRRQREEAAAAGEGDTPFNSGSAAGGKKKQQQQQGSTRADGLLMSVRPMFADDAVAAAAVATTSSGKNKNSKKKGNDASAGDAWARQGANGSAAGAAASSSSPGGAADGEGFSTTFRDPNFFMSSVRQENIDSQHLSLRGHALDLSAETAEDARAQRSVFAWNKKKNRYVKMAIHDAKALVKGTKNESGKKIDFKHTKLDAYKNWVKSTNMRVQDVGEPEDLSGVRRAHEARREANKAQHDDDQGAGAGGDDYDPSLLADPKHKKVARVGRKMKKLPQGGRVKTFEQMSLEKRKKKKEAEKLERRRTGKAQAKAAKRSNR